MSLTDYLDKGASLGPDAPCLITDGDTLSYRQVQQLSYRVARRLQDAGVRAGDKVAILSANDPIAFSCVFGIARVGAVWCPINPRNEAAENQELLELFDCACLIYQEPYEELVTKIRGQLPKLHTVVRLDRIEDWLGAADPTEFSRPSADDVAMIVGTGGTTGRPKGVVLTDRNLETMSAIALMSYPLGQRPVYLALAPLTHAAGVLCFPIMALGGVVIVMRTPELHQFVRLIAKHRVTHTLLPPTLIYMLLDSGLLADADLSSLQCFWYGTAPISTERLSDALSQIGPVMAQFFGQTEAPMMVSTMAPIDHFHLDGTIAVERLSSAGRPAPLVAVAIMDDDGHLLARGERGEIVVRSSLVMPGYYQDPQATAEASKHGWHHTGDIGYLDNDNYLYIVDRAKDMIISGGFNVYSVEVEQAIMKHPAVRECAVIGLPDDKWGERVTAVVQLHAQQIIDPDQLRAFVKSQIGSVKTPKQIEVWADLPRSRLGKVLKKTIKDQLLTPA